MRSTTKIIKLGVTGYGYPEKRNIIDLPFTNVKIGRHRDPVQLLDLAYFKLTGKIDTRFHSIHNDLGFNRFDVLHFFNKVSLSRTPWVSTFESFIPRSQSPSEKHYRTILAPSCKGLLAMSAAATRVERARLERFPHIREEIMARIQVLHPAQRMGISSMADKPAPRDIIELLFVGHLFFNKGGLETLRAMDRLLEKDAPLRLTVVSQLHIHDHVSRSGEKELAEARRIIAKYPGRIEHFSALPNAQVMDLFKVTDIALLPTYDDTYGYSVLEGQAFGCPVISTNVVALPEINNSDIGWLVELPLNEIGKADWRSAEGRKRLSLAIEDQLVDHLERIIGDPERIRTKGAAALERIRADHAPASRASFLEELYRSACPV